MRVMLQVHVEPADTESGVSWWADSPDVGGLYAVADTLAQLRAVAWEAVQDELGMNVEIVERLALDGDPTGGSARPDEVRSRFVDLVA